MQNESEQHGPISRAEDWEGLDESNLSAIHERREAVWLQVSSALNGAQPGSFGRKEDLDRLLQIEDPERLLSEEDRSRLYDALQKCQGDSEKAQSYLSHVSRLEAEHERRLLEIQQRHELSQSERELESGLQRLSVQGRQQLDLEQLELEVDKNRAKIEATEAQQKADEAQRALGELSRAQTLAVQQGLRREQVRLDAEMVLALEEHRRSMERRDQTEQTRLEWESKAREVELDLTNRRETLELRLNELRIAHSLEMERLETLKDMPLHVLLAVSDPAKTPILGELAVLEMKKGMSYEQILALAVEKHPQLMAFMGPVLQQGSEDERQLYERIIGEQKRFQDQQHDAYRDNLDRMERVHAQSTEALVKMAQALAPKADPPSQSPGIDSVTSAVTAERPDLRQHSAPDGTVTILFTDMYDSTGMTQRLGDQGMQEVLRVHQSIVQQQVGDHGGFEVKSMGDGFMLAFSSARRGLDCAIAIQTAFSRYNDARSEDRILVRLGMHTGEVINEADDFFGKAVILAARIAQQADAGQILVSGLLKDLLDNATDATFGEEMSVELKGFDGFHRVHFVLWD